MLPAYKDSFGVALRNWAHQSETIVFYKADETINIQSSKMPLQNK